MRNVTPYADPVMQDAVVQEINGLLASVVEYRFGIVSLSVNEEKETYPSVYYNDGSRKNQMLFPDNKVKSFCFWEFNDLDVLNDDEGVEYDLDFVFWGNLERIDSGKKYDYTAEIEKEILNILKGYGAFDIHLDEENVFLEYSMYVEKDVQTLMRPNTSFRINLKIHDIPCV